MENKKKQTYEEYLEKQEAERKRLERNRKARERHWRRTGAGGAVPWMKANGWL